MAEQKAKSTTADKDAEEKTKNEPNYIVNVVEKSSKNKRPASAVPTVYTESTGTQPMEKVGERVDSKNRVWENFELLVIEKKSDPQRPIVINGIYEEDDAVVNVKHVDLNNQPAPRKHKKKRSHRKTREYPRKTSLIEKMDYKKRHHRKKKTVIYHLPDESTDQKSQSNRVRKITH